ncbi:GNAT family N-acetyltransferase [Pseudonocardia abyssalis]|uniref:GNAT family N-acetyltransferase n=1 Tax=Pseudonocardia abyssalis TaxID=2792008 RepID=A0ABS6V0E9_9PSEU|nr:GNAT family N-acetyltransferase [Pseudonocardia abyssalis]MBW0114526.1 GNAT family N-acetyltransferase [Pseudonocardia abyssalis]MBW0137711.1 GNAT family N-acetyltransferase [Pseudonocardia abyssalis]
MDIRERCPVDDVALSQLHAAAFGENARLVAWGERLERHSLSWLGAFDGERLVGFVNLAWDGDRHAFLLDTVVAPAHRGAGIGTELVTRAVRSAADAGCTWLHVDFAADLTPFYVDACGLEPTAAALVRLHR